MRFQIVHGDRLVGDVTAEQGRGGRVVGGFTYTPTWIASPDAYPVDPAWPLSTGLWPIGPSLTGCLSDASPDQWGKALIRRRLTLDDPTRAVGQLDYLLGTSDTTRQGALRFRLAPAGPFEHPDTTVPKLLALSALRQAAADFESGDNPDAVRVLLDAGSGSLGGARPKAAVADGDRLLIAKFPARLDEWDVMGLEATALDLAAASGITVPGHRLAHVGRSRALLLDRFDRDGSRRIGYLSALTMLELPDSQAGDYLDIADVITRYSADPSSDLAELWRRVAFSVAINNTDDHLRNHGFLRDRSGWHLSPAFDINPSPVLGDRATSLSGAVEPALVVARLLDHAPDFGMRRDDAVATLRAIHEAVSPWRSRAAARGVPHADVERLEPAITLALGALG